VATAPRFEGRIVPAQYAKKAAKYLARDGLVLFDNPDAMLICVFKHASAPGRLRAGLRQRRPHRHPRPVPPRQGERARHARYALRGAFRRRFRRDAERLRALADTHETTARTAEELQ
jgi:hypothetical protein